VWSVSNLGFGYGSIAVSRDRIFVQGLKGRDNAVSSLNRADGKAFWSKILGPTANDDRGPGPGGRNAGMVALDKMTGKTVGTAKELSDEAGYASVIAADV
jgi:hypothetical protein